MSFKEFKDGFYLYVCLGDDETWARIKQWELEAFTASDCAVHVEKDGSLNLEMYRKSTRHSAELLSEPSMSGLTMFLPKTKSKKRRKGTLGLPSKHA